MTISQFEDESIHLPNYPFTQLPIYQITKMKLEIISPDKKLFEGEVKSVSLPGSDGSLGILNNHAPMISALKAGNVKVTDNHGVQNFPINGGVVEVLKNKVIVLAE